MAPAAKPRSARRTSPKAYTSARRVRVPKAEGAAAVRAYWQKLEPWQRTIAKRFDALVAREVPGVRRAIKWSSPMYGIAGRGWFAAFAAFKSHAKITFFRGADLRPAPPSGNAQLMRSLDLSAADAFDEKRIRSWVRQAAALPGWGSS